MKKLNKILTKKFLIKEYIENKKSILIIAKEIGCSYTAIRNHIIKHSIQIRDMHELNRGKNCHFYIDGRTTKKYYCKDCGKEINRKATRCNSCAGKITGFIDGRTLKQYYCIDCGKQISRYNATRCKHCNIKKRWQDKEFALKTRRAIFKAWQLSPNKPEKLLIKLLNKLLPKTYKFVGDGKLIVNGFCPDFANKDNNKIIEFYGDYWHTIKGAKEKDKRRLIAYKKQGYKTLVIWEHELKDLEKIKERILEFNNAYTN